MSAKEEQLVIKEDNTKVIETGMAFNVRLTLTNFINEKKDAGKESNIRNCILIADTILVTASGAEALT
jgi:nucleosome binding factor SPN SPT16 subunit